MTEPGYDPGPLDTVACEPVGQRWTLVLTRQLRHPIDKVWEAVCDPEQLAVWSPFSASRRLDEIGEVDLRMIPDGTPMPSHVLVVEPPHLLEHTWDVDVVRWQLEENDRGTLLVLRHTLDDRGIVPQVAAGWHVCLNAAEAMLEGHPLGPVQADNAKKFGWDRLNEGYAALLGVYQAP